MYCLAGINHSWHIDFYRPIMPPWLPYHDALIYISGIAEIMLGIGLMVKQTRVLAAWGLIALLIAIFPANIQMAINFVREHHPQTWVAFARLPLQLLLIYWAYVYTKPIEPSQRISR